MRSLLLLYLLIFILSFSHHHICHSPPALQLSRLPLKPHPHFRFAVANYANPVTILRNGNGTFLRGDFSTLRLVGEKGEYEYISTGISFKYPAQHRVAQVDNQVLELQVEYELNKGSGWKHKRVVMVVTFLLTEYAPQQTFSIGKQINSQLANGTLFDLSALLPLLPRLPMVLYKGKHSAYPEDDGLLWLVRKELLLMSSSQLQQVKSFIFSHLSREQTGYHGVLSRLSDLNEMQEWVGVQKQVSDLPR